MGRKAISEQMERRLAVRGGFFDFFARSAWAQRVGEPGIADFVTGNPLELPLEAYSDALRRWSVPQRPDWFAYKTSEPGARAVVAATLQERFDMGFEPEDIFMTNGTIAGLVVALKAVIDPGDEVIFISPPWFGYETTIEDRGAVPVRVKVRPPGFDLDLEAIEAALCGRTRAIILNTPHNPTGKIYGPETLKLLAGLLADASERHGRPIYLVSDEAYNRIVFDGRPFFSPSMFYPRTMLLYTYGKTLLTPGQRLGYIALPPSMPERQTVGAAIFMAQTATGWAFPNALLQHALGDLENLCIDLERLQAKRDRMVEALGRFGYDVHAPEGTFYLLPRSPIDDDVAFTDLLAGHDVFVLPGSLVELPGYFRISLTATEEMIERSLPGFEAARSGAAGLRVASGADQVLRGASGPS